MKALDAIASKAVLSLAIVTVGGLGAFFLATGKSMVNNVINKSQAMADQAAATEAVKGQVKAVQVQVEGVSSQAAEANEKGDKVIASQELMSKSLSRIYEALKSQTEATKRQNELWAEANKNVLITLGRQDEKLTALKDGMKRVEDRQDRLVDKE